MTQQLKTNTTMNDVIDDVRKAGAGMAREAGYDVSRYFDLLREAQEKYEPTRLKSPKKHRKRS